MGTRTTPRPSRKRASPQPNDSSDNDAATVKRRRSDEGDKENGEVNDRHPATTELTSPVAERPRAINAAGKPPEAGIIKSIYVENFMCHRKFTLDLCRNVNFIYGQNGSGKSAILAAIQICLGAGARRTRRARNLKDLVRKDAACNNARIRVTLLNRGDDGYHHDIYGDSITVERTIALHGGYNGYKLYDSEMKERSRSKKDLDDMLDKLNIQVENPVAILDQEEAKKFLTGKPEDKYAFFMKATELERIDRTYACTIDKVYDLDEQSSRMNQGLEADMQLVKDTKLQYEQHQEIEKLEKKLRAFQEFYAWSRHKERNQLLVEQLEHIQVFRDKAEKNKEKLTQAEEAAQGPDDEEVVKRNKLDELSREAQEQSQMKKELEQDVKRATEPLKAVQRQLKFLKKEQASAAESLRRANKRLQAKRDEIVARAGSAESEEARRTLKLKEAEDNLAAAKESHAELKQAVSDAYRAYEELEPHVEQAKQNCRGAKGRLNAVESRIASLQSSSNNSLAMFGQKCTQVKQSVDRFVQQRRFKGPVLGPIGAYVKIVQGKEQFAPIAELAIGNGALDRFIVTNDHDRKLFQKIRKDAGCRQECGVFQMHQHPRYNIPPPPVEGIETVASVLNVTDDLVFNCLVDNCKIEERALSKSKEESEQLLLVRGNNGHSIRGKVKNVFCLPDGDNWSVKHGNLNMVANEKKLRQTIGVDKSAALAEARREINGMKEELAQHSREESRFEHEHHQHQKEWNVKKRESQNNNKEIEKLISLRDKIKEDQVSAENFDTDTSEYEQVVTEAQQGVDERKENERSLTEEIEEKNPEIQDLKTRLEEVRIRNDKVLNDMRAAEDDLALYVQNLSQRQEKLERKRDKVKELENICEKQEARIKEIKGDVKNFLMKARVFTFHRQVRDEQEEADGEEVDSQLSQDPTDEELKAIPITDTDKEPTYYETRMKRAEKKIEQEKKRRNATKDDPAVAYQKYTRAKTILASRQENIEKIDKTSSILKEDVAKRKKRWRQFREHIAMMTDTRFDEVLNRKGSSGQIDFDHKTKELNLIVQKDSADANSQQRDVKALSGGERSYTTIALLLALGESLETPFRVLDEFDVFLDPVTRKLTIEALIKMAKAMQHRQFIFITPQDVSNVEVDPMLKVVKMKPPARTNIAGLPIQQTLDFSQSQS